MKSSNRPFVAEMQIARRTKGAFAPSSGAQAGLTAAALPAPTVTGEVTIAGFDPSEMLRAIAGIDAKLDRALALDKTEIDKIQIEISDISGRIKATKMEIAALRHPLAQEDKFQQASEELNAVVSATEVATNTIISCAEELEEIVHELRAQMPEGYQSSRVRDMNDVIVRIFEACNFQDLTGQRITKVVRALSFIEERVEAMLNLWNRRELEMMPLPPTVIKVDGGLVLSGPTTESTGHETFSQNDIDALFG
ncbi:chemotaxis protein CheZ [uncultured Gammaproteobacteria bacterium]